MAGSFDKIDHLSYRMNHRVLGEAWPSRDVGCHFASKVGLPIRYCCKQGDHQRQRASLFLDARRPAMSWWSILYRRVSSFISMKISSDWNLSRIGIVITSDTPELLDHIMNNTIRNTLLIAAAATALAGGTGLASAQGASDRREAPAAAAHDQKKAPEGKKTEGKAGQQPGSIPQKPVVPTAQVPEKGKPAPIAQMPEKAKPAPIVPAPGKAIESKPQTTGQGPSQSPKPGTAPAVLSTEQHVKIRETLRGERVEHLNNVQFSITVGEAIPRTVHLYRFPVSVMEYAPQYHDYEYFMVGDEILVVDPAH
jgi:hypothetical protein